MGPFGGDFTGQMTLPTRSRSNPTRLSYLKGKVKNIVILKKIYGTMKTKIQRRLAGRELNEARSKPDAVDHYYRPLLETGMWPVYL